MCHQLVGLALLPPPPAVSSHVEGCMVLDPGQLFDECYVVSVDCLVGYKVVRRGGEAVAVDSEEVWVADPVEDQGQEAPVLGVSDPLHNVALPKQEVESREVDSIMVLHDDGQVLQGNLQEAIPNI